MKKIFAAFLLLILSGFVFSCSTHKNEPAAPVIPTPDINGYYGATSAGATFKWKINGLRLDCKLSAATTGWIGIGFGPDGTMANAQNFIMGYVTSGNIATISDMHTSGHAAPSPDAMQNIINPAGTESAGVTELTFTIPLDSGDSEDMVLTPNMSVWLLFAAGPNGADDFTTPHGSSGYGALQITLY